MRSHQRRSVFTLVALADSSWPAVGRSNDVAGRSVISMAPSYWRRLQNDATRAIGCEPARMPGGLQWR